MNDRENSTVTTTSPRRSYVARIAMTAATAILVAGCGASREARPAEPAWKAHARKATPTPVPPPARAASLAYGLGGDIYVADWDGSNAVRIADGRPDCVRCSHGGYYWGEGPLWSPDGRFLAFREDASRHVVISDPKGNVVAEFPAAGWRIAWSPDSTRVAVWVEFGKTIGVYGLDGERQALLAMPDGFQPAGDHDPTWSPDGKSLLFQGVVIPVDGSVPDTPRRRAVTPSPDGSRVAYHTRKALMVAHADGSDAHPVFDGQVWSPVWSPKGDRLAFMTWMPAPLAESQLRVLDLASGTATVVADASGPDTLEAIDFSPDGHRIFFSRTNAGRIGVGSLWTVDVGGSELRLIVAGTAWGDWLSPNPTP